MDRRHFIKSLIALSVSQVLAGCFHSRRPMPPPDLPKNLVVIDVHTHVFNAADLPVRGFIEYVALSEVKIPGVKTFAALLAQVIADVGAPDYQQERDRLEILIGPAAVSENMKSVWADEDRARMEKYSLKINTAIGELKKRAFTAEGVSRDEKLFLDALTNEFGDTDKFSETFDFSKQSTAGLGDIRRYIVWGASLLRYRYQQVEALRETYPRVDLFAAALVDFDYWFEAQSVQSGQESLYRARVPIDKQMELMALISRWSNGAVHPYVAYDPLRDIMTDGQSFRWVRQAIEEQGALGVKVYPPMGFAPMGNNDLTFCDSSDKQLGEKLDENLTDLYKYCVSEEIPILAHAADTNYNGRCAAYRGRAHPSYWGKVMEVHKQLHLNFGHFGTHEIPNHSWSAKMRELMDAYDHVYADLSHVECIDNKKYTETFFSGLKQWMKGGQKGVKRLQQRILYGSDWIMVAKERVGKDYFNKLVSDYGMYIQADETDKARDWFVGSNSANYLGLIDGKNRRRLTEFYTKYKIKNPVWMKMLA